MHIAGGARERIKLLIRDVDAFPSWPHLQEALEVVLNQTFQGIGVSV